MVYDHLRHPPPKGSVLELIMMMVQTRRETTELLQTRLLVEASIGDVRSDKEDAEAVQNALKKYVYSRSPYLEKDIKDQDKAMVQEMREWTKQGPIPVSEGDSPLPNALGQ